MPPDTRSQRDRLQRVLAGLNRAHALPLASSAPAYADRTPSPHWNVYDWAPGYADYAGDPDPADPQQRRLSEVAAMERLWRAQMPDSEARNVRVMAERPWDVVYGRRARGPPRGAARLSRGDWETWDIMSGDEARAWDRRRRDDGADARDRGRETEADARDRRRREDEAAAADLRPSPFPLLAAQQHLARSLMERLNGSSRNDAHDRARAAWLRQAGPDADPNGPFSSEPPPPPTFPAGTRRQRIDAFRRGSGDGDAAAHARPRLHPTPPPAALCACAPPPPSPPTMEAALRYLHDLRACAGRGEARAAAVALGLAGPDADADAGDPAALITDLADLGAPPASSWLLPGTVFRGHQEAGAGLGPGRGIGLEARVGPFVPSGFALSEPPPPPPERPRRPLRVTLHAVDPEAHTLQGTMEAYGHGAAPADAAEAPVVTTYLEGHVVDLRAHSFITPLDGGGHGGGERDRARDAALFPSRARARAAAVAPSHDAYNWRQLPPFDELKPEDAARTLLSVAELRKLRETHVFMRWKERCFVRVGRGGGGDGGGGGDAGGATPGGSLTIAGTYYVSLRRSDGHIKGLYFDPANKRPELMTLDGETGGWGAWEFR